MRWVPCRGSVRARQHLPSRLFWCGGGWKRSGLRVKRAGSRGRYTDKVRPMGHGLLHEAPLTRVLLRDWCNKKSRQENRDRAGGVLSREVGPTTAAREGNLAFGISTDHSGGTAAELHGTSPLPWPAECLFEFTWLTLGCQRAHIFPANGSSSWVSVFRPMHAGLPASLPGDRVR